MPPKGHRTCHEHAVGDCSMRIGTSDYLSVGKLVSYVVRFKLKPMLRMVGKCGCKSPVLGDNLSDNYVII